MAILTPLWTASPLTDDATIADFLGARGIAFERWAMTDEAAALASQHRLSDADKQRLLDLFRAKLDEKAAHEGYRSADVVVIRPDMPGVDEALAKFDKVHFHDDDEVRAIVGGEGVFGFVGDDGRQFTLAMRAGEYVSLPAGMWHWFFCLESKQTTALRLFRENPSWVPHYRSTDRGQPGSRA
jgi:1,2-dihydroxy-3-keto-5-methylthiopentene dioxygenase